MDSFYDAPRRAPVPTQVEKFRSTPIVPEVSIIGSTKAPTNKYLSYNSWKMQQSKSEVCSILSSDKENVIKESQKLNKGQYPCPQNTSQFLKKQVRFESPMLQQRPSLTYEPFNRKKIISEDNSSVVIKPQMVCEELNPLEQNNVPVNRATFEQIYLSNIPNRNLDLSLIDLSNKLNKVPKENRENQININTCSSDLKSVDEKNSYENKENMLPKTYREFLETQKKVAREKGNVNDSVTDILNYKRNEFKSCHDYELKHHQIEPNLSKLPETNCMLSNGEMPKCIDNGFYLERRPVRSPLCENGQYFDFRERACENFVKNFGHAPKCDGVTQTIIASPKKGESIKKREESIENNSEPSNRDLLKIIAQQNEQLLILQKQVAMLLNRDNQHQPKQIEAPHPCQQVNYLEPRITSTQNEMFRNPKQDNNNTPKKQRPLSKFSIDLMTSFEVAIRPQHNKQNFINHEPKIQEITETDSAIRDHASEVDKFDKTLVDTSLHLQEPVKVREMCPSPEPSININMNDYDSSDDDEISASDIGATFYRNLMGQVNDILRKAQVEPKDFKEGHNSVEKFQNHTMNKVKEATLKHLKNIGVTIGPIEETDEEVSSSNDGRVFSQTEISFAVKQLLMKYLPDEQLAKVTYKQAQSVPLKKMIKPGIISNRPEFSFASVEYMKKYNLISNNTDTKMRNVEHISKGLNSQKPGAKILDITALKMQPKLL